MFTPNSIIFKKREGIKLTRDEISYFVNGFLSGEIASYQMSALLMAIFFQGMDIEEIINLTDTMLNSGDKLDLSSISSFKVDKHSTGGVGDKISLILAPIIASYGIYVPMISGRGLGFTGGTLDKLESIPGFNTKLTIKEFESIVKKVGCAIIGQTEKIVPADKSIYALRDVTATVESIPLICASILSKKFAEDTDGIVFDIKVGKGAFMKDSESGRQLSEKLMEISSAFGKKSACVLTDMDTPLGSAVGNWLEVVETVHCLLGADIKDVMELTHTLAGVTFKMSGLVKSLEEGVQKSMEAISSGKAYNKFLEMVEAQNGDISYIENLEKYNVAKYSIPVISDTDGYISEIDALKIGELSIKIGVGRMKAEDVIDFTSGIVFQKKPGDRVEIGDTLAICYTENQDILKYAKQIILESFKINDQKTEAPKSLILSTYEKA